MVRRVRWIYPALICVLIALYYVIAPARVTLVALVGVASVATIVTAALTRKPARRTAWLLIAFGVLIVVVGEASYNVLAVGGRLDDFPSAPDWFYVWTYPPFAVGMLWLALPRSRSRDWPGMIETTALTLAGSLVVWITLIQPTIESHHVAGLGEAALIAGWVGDIVVTVAAARMVVVWPRKPSSWLLAAGVAALFVGDIRYGQDLLNGTWHSGGQVDASILGFVGFVGLAALSPSMATIGSYRARSHRYEFGGLVALAIALIVTPTLLLTEMGPSPIAVPIAIVSALVGMLVIMRLSLAVAAHRRAVVRNGIMRQAARGIGLATSAADVLASLGTAFAAMADRRDTSVRLAPAAAPISDPLPTAGLENDDDAGLRVPVQNATTAEPLRDIVFSAPPIVIDDLEDELVSLAGQAGIALERIDLSARVRASEQEQGVLAYRASHDGLTGLANAELFRSELRHASHTVEPGRMTSVLFIDLDDFKNINDTLGHEAGDAVLAATAQRIRVCLRQTDLGARLGGDEFAVLLRDIGDEAAAYVVARRLTDALAQPTMIGGVPVVCRASVGLATADQTGEYQALLRNADTALYAAKADGKGQWRMYEPNMRSPLRRGSDLRIELERALRSAPGTANGLAMHYQPIVELATGRTVGLEALLRWYHPERGTISVPELIAVAEHTGLILPLGEWVFTQTFRDAVELSNRGCYVSVNVSVAQLRLAGFIERIRIQLAESGFDPEALVIEITESQIVGDDERIWDDLADLRTSGVRIAIDDYGTGYASLSYLRHPVIDIVKLDRRFLDDINGDRPQALLRAVLGLTHDLKLPMIAEGIEDEATRSALIKLSCEYGQGHLFAPAMTADEAARWLKLR